MAFKIRVTQEMKKVLFVSEMPFVREMQKEFSSKDNTETLEDYGKKIASLFGEYPSRVKVFEPHAEIAKNVRADDVFGTGSGNLDVWIECYIFGDNICGEFGAYITDLWSIDVDGDNKEEIKERIYANIYKCQR